MTIEQALRALGALVADPNVPMNARIRTTHVGEQFYHQLNGFTVEWETPEGNVVRKGIRTGESVKDIL